MDGVYTAFILAGVGAVVLFMVLRRVSTIRVNDPSKLAYEGKVKEGIYDKPKEGQPCEVGSLYELQGEYRDTSYVVTRYDGRYAVVAIELAEAPKVRAEVNARIQHPRVEESALTGEINALFGLGAVYVDIGKGASWVAAEFPIDGEGLSRRLIERALDHLIRLRDIATGRAV